MQHIIDDATELLPLVDEQGILIGAASRSVCHDGSKPLHPVVHLHVFNDSGELYLQKRPEWKSIQPGKWDTAVGGHVGLGETAEIALRREADEELGIIPQEPVLKEMYVYESDIEKELVFTYQCVCNGEIKPSEETDGGAFWHLQDIEAALGSGVFTPNFEDEFRRFFMNKKS